MHQNRELQSAILKIGKEIHRLCTENGIAYMMQGGTMLGAIRHKGFIPWDDDIDFGMTWENYKKFISLVKKNDHPWLYFDIPSAENISYGKLFIKAYDKNTTFIEWDKNDEAKGVFVDIFPIAYGTDTKEGTLSKWKKFQFIRALMDRKNYTLHQNFSLKDRLLRLISCLYTHKSLISSALNFYEDANKIRAEYSMAYEGTKKDAVKSVYYETPFQLYPFEDTEFYGVADYDGWLTDVFKDYMKMPPKEMQVPHHCKFLDLNLPYADYNKLHGKK